MKLTVFNAETMPKGLGDRSGQPKISFGKKGAIMINKAGVERLGIEAGDCISFAQDEEYPANWYVFQEKGGFAVNAHSDGKSMVLCHKQICISIKESLGLPTNQTIPFLIAGQPETVSRVKYWGLINVKK